MIQICPVVVESEGQEVDILAVVKDHTFVGFTRGAAPFTAPFSIKGWRNQQDKDMWLSQIAPTLGYQNFDPQI